MRYLVVFVAASLLVGCGEGTKTTAAAGEEPVLKKGSFQGDGYSFDPPAGWEEKPVALAGLSGVSFLEPAEPGAVFRTNIVMMLEPLPTKMTIKEYAEKAVPMLSSMVTDYKLVDQ